MFAMGEELLERLGSRLRCREPLSDREHYLTS